MWSLYLQVETAVDITRNAMGTRRRTQYRPSLQIPWDLVIIALADCVTLEIYDAFRGVGPIKYFVLQYIQKLQIHKYVFRLF
jgi:hypothetical protein